jgi:hypothetical protein
MVDYDNVLVVYYDRVLVLCEQLFCDFNWLRLLSTVTKFADW